MNYTEFKNYLLQKNTNNKDIHSDKTRQQKFRTLLLLLILIFSGIAMILVKAEAKSNTELQSGIAGEIIRFHVIANSDSEEDQALKLTVKGTLVDKLSPLLSKAGSKTEARNLLEDNLPFIKEVAEETIQHNGYSYPVQVSLEKCYFPVKVYGDFTFPQGYYEALRVKIGDAKGKNWWCVMFPPLCFVDETYGIIDENSKKKLEYLLTDEEYEALFQKDTPIKLRFKLWETIVGLFQ